MVSLHKEMHWQSRFQSQCELCALPRKAVCVVRNAPRLLRLGERRCAAEDPGRHPVAKLGRGRAAAVAHDGCSDRNFCRVRGLRNDIRVDEFTDLTFDSL